jgi:2-aminoethylphosphonate-pyruvate transaminase
MANLAFVSGNGVQHKRPLVLLTPGPLTTAVAVRQAMLLDYGSRDEPLLALTRRLRNCLNAAAEGGDAFVCVPLQGSGTFAIEAAVSTLVPRKGGLLVLSNGAYGRRMAEIARRLDRLAHVLESPENLPIDPGRLDQWLGADGVATHVGLIHCETSSGLLNPLESIATVVNSHGRRLIVDAMSSFGALPIHSTALGLEALVFSSNKCLESVPGVSFVVVRRAALESAQHGASLSLDLLDQWRTFENTGEWRFTPPVQVLAALGVALDLWADEGGQPGRRRRYESNLTTLLGGMERLGLKPYIARQYQAPIIAAFRYPAHPRFQLDSFLRRVREGGYLLYPGKVTDADTFRVGCMGAITSNDMQGAVCAISDALHAIGVASTEARGP